MVCELHEEIWKQKRNKIVHQNRMYSSLLGHENFYNDSTENEGDYT